MKRHGNKDGLKPKDKVGKRVSTKFRHKKVPLDQSSKELKDANSEFEELDMCHVIVQDKIVILSNKFRLGVVRIFLQFDDTVAVKLYKNKLSRGISFRAQIIYTLDKYNCA